MRTIRLAPDYFCYPIWHDDGELSGEFGDIDPRSLPISKSLANELLFWSNWYDRGLDVKNPGNSYWAESEKNDFFKMGDALFQRLCEELKSEFIVNKKF